MSATQLPKPGDRFRWKYGPNVFTVAAVTEHNVFYEREDGYASVDPIVGWLNDATPIPPKPHVEPVQWGYVRVGRFLSRVDEGDARFDAKHTDNPLAKLDHGVLWLEAGGEWVRAFDGVVA